MFYGINDFDDAFLVLLAVIAAGALVYNVMCIVKECRQNKPD